VKGAQGIKLLAGLIAAVSFFTSGQVYSGVEIQGTRVIYPQASNQVALDIKNPDNRAYLIQAWAAKKPDINDHDDQVFVMTPPLFRLEPTSTNSVRIVYTGKPLPDDKESLYWLSIKSIPSTNPDEINTLTINVKSVMKLFFRPTSIKGDPATAYQGLKFKFDAGRLHIINPSPYYITLATLLLDNKKVPEPPMIPPHAEVILPGEYKETQNISWQSINDFGGVSNEMKLANFK